MKSLFPIFFLILYASIKTNSQSRFFREYWLEYTGAVNNNLIPVERTRVNDVGMSTHEWAWNRTESHANGLALINVADTIVNLEKAELYLELWGGHPGTANKRFQINGRKTYFIPGEGTEDNNCEYTFPVIPIDFKELVTGNNALQFTCDRGKTFWGHFIVDEAAIRCYLKKDHPDLVKHGFDKFKAVPATNSKILKDKLPITLQYPEAFQKQIVAVHYFGRYFHFQENGNNSDWHGYTQHKLFKNHIGTATQPPFLVNWDAHMVSDQGKPIAIRALIELKDSIYYWSDILDGLSFEPSRNHVQLYSCVELPKPFWSRDKQMKTAQIELPKDISNIESAELHVRIWDGGEGSVKEPFKLNGHAYKITAGGAPHELVYTINQVNPEHLKPGINNIELISDTEHHGIEICLPGPTLIVRYKANKQ
jgi:hypothetical protein